MSWSAIVKILSCCFISLSLYAQNNAKKENTNAICSKTIPIDSLEFFKNKQNFTRIDSISAFKKVKGVIKITTKDSALIFRDHKTKRDLIEYNIIGQDSKNKWLLLSEEDSNQDYYYLINLKNNKIEKLVGYPMVYGNKILCQEGSYTDSTGFIEIWNSDKGNLSLVNKFSFNACKIFNISDLYLKKNILYVRYNSNKYLKLKL